MIYLTSVPQGYEIAVVFLHVCDFCITCNLSARTFFLSQYELAYQNTCTCHECIILLQIHVCESLPKPPLPQRKFFLLTFLTSAAAQLNRVKFQCTLRIMQDLKYLQIKLLKLHIEFTCTCTCKCKCVKAGSIYVFIMLLALQCKYMKTCQSFKAVK